MKPVELLWIPARVRQSYSTLYFVLQMMTGVTGKLLKIKGIPRLISEKKTKVHKGIQVSLIQVTGLVDSS